jgi:8-oxo-dGTP diphosphatase
VNRLISFGNKKCDIEYIKRKGVYGIVNECNHVLLIKSNNKLILPGGGIEDNESLTDCLKREFLEELNCRNIKIDSYIGSARFYDFVNSVQKHYEMTGYFFAVSINKDEISNNILWLKKNELNKNYILPHHKWAIDKYFEL